MATCRFWLRRGIVFSWIWNMSLAVLDRTKRILQFLSQPGTACGERLGERKAQRGQHVRPSGTRKGKKSLIISGRRPLPYGNGTLMRTRHRRSTIPGDMITYCTVKRGCKQSNSHKKLGPGPSIEDLESKLRSPSS